MYTRRYVDVDPSSLKEPIAILGLPGIANVGKIAVETLAAVIGAQPVMDFFSGDFPARVFVKEGITKFPKSSLSLYRAAPDEPHDLLILSADFQPASSQGVFEYADFVVQEFTNLGIKEVYALAAYETSYQEFFDSYPLPPRVFVSASSEPLLDRISTINGTIATKEGVVNGANGFIPAWAASMYNMEGACLLGETLGIIKLDYRAARMLLDTISVLIGLKASFEIIDDDVEKVIDFIDWAQKEITQKRASDEDGPSPRDQYIG
ncbi:MAG: PAC2 family protein [Candidatus Hodarchaeota archaeon]